MKKAAIILLCVTVLCSCAKAEKKEIKTDDGTRFLNGIWISYTELDEMALSGDFRGEFKKAAENCAKTGITDIFLHTVSFCDSVYESKFYPTRKGYSDLGFDALACATEISHEAGLRIHVWMNPYRVKTADCDISSLPDKSPAKKWLTDESDDNDKNVCISGGIYLNPASEEVRKTVIGAVREVIAGYDIDGVHFDDYFYPTSDAAFDAASYGEYRSKTDFPVSLAEYRKSAVNALISGTYTAVKFINKDLIFSVSPAASIEKNQESYYADVASWCKSGCLDYIIPQLYFGFEYPNESFRFLNLLEGWKQITRDTEVKLAVGLAAYKMNTAQVPDNAEWQKGAEVLIKETEVSRGDSAVSGIVYFSYKSVFAENETAVSAKEGIAAVDKSVNK